MGLSPHRAVVAEDLRDLQRCARHRASSAGWDREILQWTFDRAQGAGSDLRVAGGVIEFLMAEQYLDDADIGLLLQ